MFFDLPKGVSPNDYGIEVPAEYSYQEFRNDVGAALVSHFGVSSIVRGNKAFDVHANTYRVDADVVACFEYKWYQQRDASYSGTAFLPDHGSRVNNWPQQNYDNGVAKNDATGRRFKGVVRILKRLRNEMTANGVTVANPIPSFLLECLTWNVPNDGFGHDTLRADVRYALAHLYNNTVSDDKCAEWGEINELKYLFGPWQPWRRADVNAFLDAAWKYVDFE